MRLAWYGRLAALCGAAVACGGGGATSDTAARAAAPGAPPGVAGGAAAARPAAPQSAATNAAASGGVPTVLFVGTSLTAGLGLDPDEAFPQRVADLAAEAGDSIRIVNAGLSGETSAGALRRIDWLLRAPADVIVLETGANDGLRGIDPDSTRANLAAIVQRVRAVQPRARLVLVQMEAPPNLGATYTRAFRAMYPAVAEEYGLPLVPFLLEGVAGKRELNQQDGMHPSAEGARIIARTVWRALQPVVREVEGGLPAS